MSCAASIVGVQTRRSHALAAALASRHRYYELVDEIEEERMFMAGKLNKKDLEVVDKTSHGGRCGGCFLLVLQTLLSTDRNLTP